MLFKMALRNLWANRKKTMSALASIAIGFVALSLFEGYLNDLQNQYFVRFSKQQMRADIIIERKNADYPGKAGMDEQALSKQEQDWIDSHLADVTTRVRFLNINGILRNGRTKSIFVGQAYDLSEGLQVRSPEYAWNTFAGLPMDQTPGNQGFLLGRGLGEIMGCDTHNQDPKASINCGQSLLQLQVNTASGQANGTAMFVTGLTATGFAAIDSYLAMMPLARAQQLFNTDRVSYVAVKLNNRVDGEGWVRQFNSQAQAHGVDIEAQRWQDHPFGELYRQTMDFLQVFQNLVMAIILIVVSMSAINTFVKIIHERRREIGTMRCLGYRPVHIVRLFSIEAALLAVSGAIVGVLMALLCRVVINNLNVHYKGGLVSEGIPFRISFFLADFLWISLLLTILTMIATLLPTLAANRQKLVNILEDR